MSDSTLDKLQATMPPTPTPEGATPPISHFISPDGKVVELDPSVQGDALSIGYKPATPENLRHLQYGTGILNPLKAAALGAGEGATFGLSTAALTKSGAVDPETIKALEEENPISYGAGTAAGVIVPALFGDEAGLASGAKAAAESPSLISQAAKYAPTSLVHEFGKAITEAADFVPPNSASKVLQYANDIGTRALGTAAEGAAYGAGNSITEASLGDPDLNGEKVWANIAGGAALGGLGGAALEGIVRPFARTILGAAAPGGAIDYGAKKVANVLGVPEAATERYMADPEGVLKARPLQEISDEFQQKVKDLRVETSKESTQAFEMLANHPDPVTGKPMRLPVSTFTDPLQTQITRLENLTTLSKDKDDAVKILNNLITDLNDHAADDGSIPLDWGKATTKEIDGILYKGQPNLFTKSPELDTQVAKSYSLARQAIDDNLKTLVPDYKKLMEEIAEKTNSIKSVAANLKNPKAVDNMMKRVMRGNESDRDVVALKAFDADHETNFYEDLKNSWANDRFNADTTNGSRKTNLGGWIGGAIGTASGGFLGHSAGAGIGSVIGAVADKYGGQINRAALTPFIAMKKLAATEDFVNKFTNKMGYHSAGVFSGKTTRTLEPILRGAAVGAGNASSREPDPEQHAEVANRLNTLVNNPQQLIDHVTSITDPLYPVAPKITQAANATAMRATNFLQSKLPQKSPDTMFGKAPPVNNAQVNKFNNYFDIIRNPLSIFEHIQKGTLAPDHIEAMSNVYPSILNEMKTSLLDKLSGLEDPSTVPYPTRIALSRLLGTPMDRSMEQKQMLNNQQAMQTLPQPAPKPSAKGMREMTIGERMKGTFEQAATREK